MAIGHFADDPRTNLERMLAGDPYIVDDPEIARRQQRAMRLAAEPRRDKLEAALPIVIGDNVWLGGGVIVCPGVTIGDNAVVGRARSSPRTCPPTSSP
jgi:acetyltransferase-like isoleucine patch superfamily enzyme